jgi:hypothetical protein
VLLCRFLLLLCFVCVFVVALFLSCVFLGFVVIYKISSQLQIRWTTDFLSITNKADNQDHSMKFTVFCLCSYFVVLCFFMFCSCFVVIVVSCILIFVCTSVGLLPPGESPIAVSK